MQLSFCKYHKREEPLCKAHILPNAFYRHLRSRGADGFWLNKIGTKEIKRVPGGLYDASILCCEADHEMGRYDEYGASVFKEDHPGSIFIDEAGRECARIENLNVGLMNLFLLSYIWRCHHAQIEPFKDFDVGAIYEERIRQKLLRKDANPVRWFSYVIKMIYGDIDDTLLPLKFPFKTRVDGGNFVFLYFLNFKIILKLDNRSNFGWFDAMAASPGKPVMVPLQAYRESSDYDIERLSLRNLLAAGASW